MKKIISLVLITAMCILIVGCGKKEPVKVELTSKNLEDYIILNVQLDDTDIKTKSSILGTEYKGTAKLKATAKLKKDVKTEDVVIEGLVTPHGLVWSGEKYEFKLELDKNGEAEYSKDIETPYSILKPEETPSLTKYVDEVEEGQFLAADDKALITSLTGSVYEDAK